MVATAPGQTNVEVTFSVNTQGHQQGLVGSYQAGETGIFTLSQGEVLQFAAQAQSQCRRPIPIDVTVSHCDSDESDDLSGSFVRSDKPIEVFGSHACAFIPNNVFACDHLEESIFPLNTWGSSAVVPKIKPLLDEPSLVKITSGEDGNVLSFTPPTAHPTVTLKRGEKSEFETRSGLVVNGTRSLQVTQFLVGQNYSANASQDGFGDPAMSLVPPADQFRKDYTILAPDTYAKHFINLAFKANSNILIDGMPVTQEGQQLGSSTWRELTVEVSGGVHTLQGDSAFGVWVYGFGNYTSYMYPGGLDLKVINDVP